MEIVFASNNAHKIEEVRSKLPGIYNVVSLKEAIGDVDIRKQEIRWMLMQL